MPFYPGSAADRLSRRAVIATDLGQADGPLALLVGKDTFFGGAGQTWPVDAPNPSFALLARQSAVARTAADVGQFDTPLPSFVGTDAFFAGRGAGPDYDYPNPSFAVPARQNIVARTASDAGQWASPTPELIGPLQQFPPGADVFDLPARATARANDYGQISSFPLSLIGQDQGTTGAQSQALPPKAPLTPTLSEPGVNLTIELAGVTPVQPPGLAALDQQYRTVPRARDYSLTVAFPLELIGKDAVNPGAQLSGNAPAGVLRVSTVLDPGVNLTLGLAAAAAVVIPPGQAALDGQYRPVPRARDYSIAASYPLGLIGADQFNVGAQANDQQYRLVPRARDYTWLQSFSLETIGPLQQFPVGQDIYDLAPVAAARSRDYSFTAAFFQGLIGQDAFPAGAQLSGNAPAAARRATEYTFLASFPLFLIGQDQFNAGQSAQDQQYRLTPRSRDYTFAAAAFQGLSGKDAFNPGAQISGNAPSGPLRASTLSETGSNQILGLVALPPVFPYGQSTAATALAPTAAARARDYSFTAAFPLELVGKDQFFGVGGPAYDYPNPSFARLVTAQQLAARLSAEVGQWASPVPELIGQDKLFGAPGEAQAFDWTPPVRTIPRSFALYDPGVNLAILLPVIASPLPAGVQSTDLPVRVIARAATLSEPGVNLTNLPLSVSLPAGAQSEDLPPRPTPRSREYGQTAGFPLELIGKDQIAVGDSTASSELPPKAPQRANDYTWLQSLPLYQYEQLPPGQSTAASEVPPRAPARARDYTWLQSLRPYLIGQDTLYGAPGEVPAYDWQNPRGPARLLDYTSIWSLSYGPLVAAPPVSPMGAQLFDLPARGPLRLAAAGYSHTSATPFSLVAKTRDIIHIIGAPQAKWIVGRVPVSSRWRIDHPRQ